MSDASDHYAVFGRPIGHSLSPELHRCFAAQTGEDLRYSRIEPEADGFAEALQEFLAGGGHGANITLPFKAEAFERAERKTARAEQAGSVNTLKVLDDGRLLGDNTDGAGLVRDLVVNRGWQAAGKRVLLLGAGGAARGAIGPLIASGIESLHIANRTPERALALCEEFRAHALVSGGPLDPLPRGGFDLIVNATSASTLGLVLDLPEHLLEREPLCYDMAYGREETPFLAWAREHGATTADGWGMLVEQAAEAFELWRGIRPETESLLAGPWSLDQASSE